MLIKKDPDVIKSYLEDSSNISGGYTDEVMIPETAEEVSEILAEASRKGVPVTVSGGGTGTTGARVAFGGRIGMTRLACVVTAVVRCPSPIYFASRGTNVISPCIRLT